jgi:hypothetical protein
MGISYGVEHELSDILTLTASASTCAMYQSAKVLRAICDCCRRLVGHEYFVRSQARTYTLTATQT